MLAWPIPSSNWARPIPSIISSKYRDLQFEGLFIETHHVTFIRLLGKAPTQTTIRLLNVLLNLNVSSTLA